MANILHPLKVVSILLLISCTVFSAELTEIQRSKLHPLFQSLIINPTIPSVKSTKGLQRVSSITMSDGTIRFGAIVYTHDAETIRSMGIPVNSVLPDFITAHLTIEDITKLSQMESVQYLDPGNILLPMLDASVSETRASLVQSGSINNTPYKGGGVIVLIYDTGIDWKHFDFRKAGDTTKSRILCVWDQTITSIGSEHPPAGFNYGVEYTQAQIEGELNGTARGFVREKDINGHGTHVASIAAGNGHANYNKYVGMAPEADIIVVKGGDYSFAETDEINGLTYAQNKAAALGKPIVVNMSIGGQSGPHDGTNADEVAVNNFVQTPGRVVCIAAGNDGNSSLHINGTVSNGSPATITINVPSYSGYIKGYELNSFSLDLWLPISQQLSVSIKSPSNIIATPADDAATTWGNQTDGTIDAINRIEVQNNHRHIYIKVHDNTTYLPKSGSWTITLTTTGSAVSYDGWLMSDLGGSKASLPAGNVSKTVTMPGTAAGAITAGSYVSKYTWSDYRGNPWYYPSVSSTGNISSFSSIGPTADNRQKPDITAPGYIIAAALSSSIDTTGKWQTIVTSNKYQMLYGTSMACPHLTGATALLLCIRPTLTSAQIKNYLTTSARTDGYTSSGSINAWGYGKMDAYKACSLAASGPMISISSKRIVAGPVRIGQSKDTVITLTNTGGTPIIVSTITSGSSTFSARPTSLSIPVGYTMTDTLRFSPNKYNADSTKIIITSNALSSPDTVCISGTSPTPVLTIAKTVGAFGNLAKNTTKKDTVKIINTSINTLAIDSIYTKTNTFSVNQVSGTVGSDTLKIIVSFTPSSFSPFSDTVFVRNNSLTPLVKIPLTGSSPFPVPVTSKSLLAFGNVAKNVSKSDTLKISNTSVNVLTIDSLYTKTNAFTVDRISGTVGTDTLKIVVVFTPTTPAVYIDTLYVRNNSITSLVKIPLTGNAVAPVLLCAPQSVNFGNVKKASTTLKTISVTDTSISTLFIDSIFTKTNTFTVDRTNGTVGKDTMKIVVSFTPASFSPYTDTVFLRNNSLTPLVKIPLSGNCPAPALSAAISSLNFGDRALSDYTSRTVSLKNLSVNALTLSKVSNATSFFDVTAASMTIAGLDSMAVTVIYWPLSFGTSVDTLTALSDGGTVKIPLVGSSPYPIIVASKSSMTYGPVATNATKSDTVKVSNSSINILTIDSISTRSKYFIVASSTGSPLIFPISINKNKGDTLKLLLTFRPDTIRVFADTLYARSNSNISVLKIPLGGYGTPPMEVKNEFAGIPKQFELFQNYPNPFNPSTTIRYALPTRSMVRLQIFNMLGQVVLSLVNAEQPEGFQSIIWNASNASGMYFYRIEATEVGNPGNRFVDTKKMILLK